MHIVFDHGIMVINNVPKFDVNSFYEYASNRLCSGDRLLFSFLIKTNHISDDTKRELLREYVVWLEEKYPSWKNLNDTILDIVCSHDMTNKVCVSFKTTNESITYGFVVTGDVPTEKCFEMSQYVFETSPIKISLDGFRSYLKHRLSKRYGKDVTVEYAHPHHTRYMIIDYVDYTVKKNIARKLSE